MGRRIAPEGDRIATRWVGVDMLGLFVQLGAVASPWQAGE